MKRSAAVVIFVIFAMAFLLTPRVWVSDSTPEVDHIPVDMLEAGDRCLWCTDLTPVDCTTEQAPAPPTRDTLLTHPDEAPPEREATPCLKPAEDEASDPKA